MIWKHAIARLGMVPLAILNAVVREARYKRCVGELRAHQTEVVT
jgi:hypothetical protein